MDLRELHFCAARKFVDQAKVLGYGNLHNYYWYHTIDLGNNLTTPGCYDYRSSFPLFQFPTDMTGMRILDVGSATGFFSFAFEKRGAEVLSVEVPSLYELDVFPGENINQTLTEIKAMMYNHSAFTNEQNERLFREKSPEEIYFLLLDGPFQFCSKVLKSQVKRCYSNIYDLSLEKTGGMSFDLVFIGDVLLHTLYPLKALATVASLCKGKLIISQCLPSNFDSVPAMVYVGGDQPGQDAVSWFWPNLACFEQLLKKLGFQEVSLVGHHEGIVKPGGGHYKRAILHASRKLF